MLGDTIDYHSFNWEESYVPLGVYEKDFTFLVNIEEIKTSRIISDLLSPKISQNHLIDPTIHTSYNPKNCIYHENAGTYYASKQESNAWVCLEFKNHRIIPTDYTIRSTNNGIHIRSWVLEGSEDNSEWDVIDKQDNCEYMNGDNRIQTFKIQNECKKQYRFIRLLSTSPA